MKRMLKIDSLPAPPAAAAKSFLLEQFYRCWQPQDTLPLEYLPPSPLRPLLDLSKAELVQLIEFYPFMMWLRLFAISLIRIN